MNRGSVSSNEQEQQMLAEYGQVDSATFDHFVDELGDLLHRPLDFEHCNKFLRFKKSEYLTTDEVLEYYRKTFGKKTNSSLRRKWHIKDKFVLCWVVTKYCEKNLIQDYKITIADWRQIAAILRICARFIMRKWICLLRHTTIHFHWDASQEQILVKYMANKQYDSKWSQLSLKIFEESGSSIMRNCKDIRERWKNYLDPRLKRTNWCQQEDNVLVQLIKQNGKKWSLISKHISGRTENQVKNRYITLSKKNKFLFENEDEMKEEHEEDHEQHYNVKEEDCDHDHEHGDDHHDHDQIMSHRHHQTHQSMGEQQNFIESVLKGGDFPDLQW